METEVLTTSNFQDLATNTIIFKSIPPKVSYLKQKTRK